MELTLTHESRTIRVEDDDVISLSNALRLIEDCLHAVGFIFDRGSLSVEVSNKEGDSIIISSGDEW